MRIWFIEIGEPLPLEQGKRLLRYGRFTSWLAARGHDVTWWTCDFSHAVKTHVVPLGEHKLDSGVRMVVLPGRGYDSNISFARFRHHRAYARELKKALEQDAQKGELPDLIICPIPTVENAGVVSDFAKKHDIPVILDIRDHWPEDLAERFPRIVRPLAKLWLAPMYATAKRAARQATSMSGVTRLQMDYGLRLAARKEDQNRDHVFYLGYSRTPLSAPARNDAAAWWRAQGLKTDAKIVAFTGTLGVSFDFTPIIESAKRLHAEGRRDIQFVIAGDGGNRTRLIEAAENLVGDTILFPGWIDQARIDALLSTSFIALAPYRPNTSMSLPNKFFEYMAYGLPVLSSCTGESEDLIRQYGFGIQYNPKTKDDFHAALLEIVNHPETANSMGEAALTLFEKQFDQSMLFAQMERHMNHLVKAA